MKKEIFIGNVGIGGNHPVSIQSMTSTNTKDIKNTLKQIEELKKAGCEIIRVAIPERDYLNYFEEIVKKSTLPVIADIHFDYLIAVESIKKGAKGIRINPGNIGSKKGLNEILKAAKDYKIPIRIGVNSGSIEKKYKIKDIPIHEAMVLSALDYIKYFEDNEFDLIKLSLKSSDVIQTVKAYRLIDKKCDYPLHLGITEAGTRFGGTIKSSIGIGSLLLDGIGNTIRVSLTDNPVEEIKVAKEILKVLGLRDKGIEIISCPTCSRITVNLIEKVNEFEKKIEGLEFKKKIKVAIMGCEVNGPGEAEGADIGIAFSKKRGYIFYNSKRIDSIEEDKAIERLIQIIKEKFL